MSRVGGEESINSMAYSQRLIHARSFDIQERCVPWYNPTYVHSCVPRYLQLHIHPVEMYIDTAKTPPRHTTEPYIYHHRSGILASLPVCLSVCQFSEINSRVDRIHNNIFDRNTG